MRDFTLSAYKRLIESLIDASYVFLTFKEYIRNPPSKFVILRNDVDKNPDNSLIVAKILSGYNIRGTFYFRILKNSFKPEIIREIQTMGHEIGYHYEDLCLVADEGLFNRSSKKIEEILVDTKSKFLENLTTLRQYAPVDTICMHGRPLSKWDSRMLWLFFDYRDFDIIGEPYFDLDLSDTLYLTDTGRRWDGSKVSIRDKMNKSTPAWLDEEYMAKVTGKSIIEPKLNSAINLSEKALIFQQSFSFRSTKDILHAASGLELPDKLMITFHPQRWTEKLSPWILELISQNAKNIAKYLLMRLRKSS